MHGGTNPGPPPITGRSSRYALIFGARYLEAKNAPDVLDSRAELALFDTFLSERAELLDGGFSAEWLTDCRVALNDLRRAMFEEQNAAKARQAFAGLETLIHSGGQRCQAWEEMLDKARTRADLAVKAQAAELRAGEKMTEAALVGMMMKFLDVLEDVAGTDTAKRVADKIDAAVFRGAGGVGEGTRGEVRRPAPGGVAVLH
jgi:hypothetical protein